MAAPGIQPEISETEAAIINEERLKQAKPGEHPRSTEHRQKQASPESLALHYQANGHYIEAYIQDQPQPSPGRPNASLVKHSNEGNPRAEGRQYAKRSLIERRPILPKHNECDECRGEQRYIGNSGIPTAIWNKNKSPQVADIDRSRAAIVGGQGATRVESCCQSLNSPRYRRIVFRPPVSPTPRQAVFVSKITYKSLLQLFA